MKQQERYKQAKQVTLLGAMVNALLGLGKLIGGFLYHSHALIADGIHSFSDLITDAMVLFASKYGSQHADIDHPYGHQRIETAATLILALLLILAGLGIAVDGLEKIFDKIHTKPGWLALPIVLVSIVANEILYHYTHYVGKCIQSPLIIANAWHHRSDAAASIVVALGITGSLLGFTYLDALAATIVGFLIIKMGINYAWNSVKELVDTAVEPDLLKKIAHLIQSIDGVDKIHQLRSRLMGGDILIDVHILVDPFISVSEGHFIAQQVQDKLIKHVPKIKDITIHVDPEDDQLSCPSQDLPNREHLQQDVLNAWQNIAPDLQSWTLHYLDGKVVIDLFCNNQRHTQTLVKQIEKDLDSNSYIREVRIFKQLEIICHKNNKSDS